MQLTVLYLFADVHAAYREQYLYGDRLEGDGRFGSRASQKVTKISFLHQYYLSQTHW